MCIIAVIPKDQTITYETIENMFTNNPDGSGFMYSDGGKVIIKKGYMKLAHFWADFIKIPPQVDIVCHFRIATSGKINPGNCHPFPLIGEMDQMQLLRNTAKVAVAHNGIISFCTPNKTLQSDYSDTMIFLSEYMHKMGGAWKKNSVRKMIQLATGSKFAIMTPEQTFIIGDFQFINGVYYSNSSYLKATYRMCDYQEDWGYGNWQTHAWNPVTKKYDIPRATQISTWRDNNLKNTEPQEDTLLKRDEVDTTVRAIVVPTKTPTDHLAKSIMKELEDSQGLFVDNYELYQRLIMFELVGGLPTTKLLKGHGWKQLSDNAYKNTKIALEKRLAEKETDQSVN